MGTGNYIDLGGWTSNTFCFLMFTWVHFFTTPYNTWLFILDSSDLVPVTWYLGSSWHINRIVWKSPIWQLIFFLWRSFQLWNRVFWFLIGYTSETLREVWWFLWASPIFGSFRLELARWRNPSLWFQHIRKHIRQLHCGLSPHASEHSEHFKQIGCHSGVFASYHSCPDV